MARGSKPFRRNGRWAGVVDVGTDPLTGKRRQRWVTGDSAQDVTDQIHAILVDRKRGVYVEPLKLTVGDYLQRWLDMRPAAEIAVSTRESYQRVIDLHLVPGLGNYQLQQLAPMDIQRFYTAKRDAGLSEARLQTIHSVLSGALRQALLFGMIVRNPCTAVRTPHGKPPEIVTWDSETSERFIDATALDPLGIAWHLALYTTMRRGEVLGLRWRDVDLDGRVARVSVQVPHLTPTGWVWPDLKTSSSRRTIPLRSSLVVALREHRKRQAERRLGLGRAWTDLGLVVDRGDGQPWRPTTVSWEFADAVRRHGMPRISLHGLRHTAITLLLASGIPQQDVRRIAGHASVVMTDRYTHPTDAHLQAQVDRMDERSG